MLPDVMIEDRDANERGVVLWVFVADQCFDVDPIHGNVWPANMMGDVQWDEGPLTTLHWHDPECGFCSAPLSTSYPVRDENGTPYCNKRCFTEAAKLQLEEA
jgi:hypothetical protein